MKRKGLIALVCFASMLLFSGCWSEEEPKNLAIINSILYDVKDDGTYRVVVEFLNPVAAGGTRDSAPGGGNPHLTIDSESDNVRVALTQVSASMERHIYASHNKVRLFTDKIARNGIASILDYVLRDHFTIETPLMVVINEDEPEQIYSAQLGLSGTVGDYIEHLSRYQQQSISQSVFVDTLGFVKDYFTEGKEPVMGLVELIEGKQKSASDTEGGGAKQQLKIEYRGLAAFKGDKLVGYMNGIEARAYNFLTNNITTTYIYVANSQGVSVLELEKSKVVIKPVVEGDSVDFHVNFTIAAWLISEDGAVDVTINENLKPIEESLNQQIMIEIGECIVKAQQEFGSDIFGFGSYVHMEYPQKWREIKANWNDYFVNAQINITVDSKIDRTGEIKEPFIMEDWQ